MESGNALAALGGTKNVLLETRKRDGTWVMLQGRLVPWAHRRKGWTTCHYEVAFADLTP